MLSKLVVTHKPLPYSFLLLLISISASVVAVAPLYYPDFTMTNSGYCSDRCGGISIPFPFGIGRNCSLDDWYEIVCNDELPWLKKLGLQVLRISYPFVRYDDTGTTVTVNYPIFYDNSSCSPRTATREPVSFYGSPFFFSEHNTFFAVGCNSSAMMRDSDPSFVGCSTDQCGGNDTSRFGACNGVGCCQSTIPYGLQGFSIDFKGVPATGGGGNQDCQFALLVDPTWSKLSNLTGLVALRDQNYTPVTLKWGIRNQTFLDSLRVKPYKTYYGYYSSSSTWCAQTTVTNSKTNTTFMNCVCELGYYGNPYIQGGCTVNNCENFSNGYSCYFGFRWLMPVIIAVGGAIILLFLALWLRKYIRRRKKMNLKQKFFKQNGGLLLQQQLASPQGSVEKSKLFDSKELEKATDNFNENRILGKGGQGTVYKGMLMDGRIVAVKRSTVLDEGNVEQFINEVFILSQINHRNVVKLLGCCLETEVPLLVYEFISNGTLYEYLHEPTEEFPVSWNVRLRIASEVAGALSYLHSAASMPIYHRDIKTTNILLDEKYRAKIADFGTSKSAALDQTHVTTLVKGTFGYLDPEYFQSSQFTDKSDVYSFGVVLVELLTGQKPISSLRVDEGRSLATYFIVSMEGDRLFDIIDHQVLNQGDKEEILRVALLAERCLNLNGRKRPTMTEVAMELEAIRKPPHSSDAQHTEPMRGNFEIEGIEAHDVAFRSAGYEAGDGDGASPTTDVYLLLSSGTW